MAPPDVHLQRLYDGRSTNFVDDSLINNYFILLPPAPPEGQPWGASEAWSIASFGVLRLPRRAPLPPTRSQPRGTPPTIRMIGGVNPPDEDAMVPTEDHHCSSKHCYSIVRTIFCLKDDKQQHGKHFKIFLLDYTLQSREARIAGTMSSERQLQET